jgi:hypothetical protein
MGPPLPHPAPTPPNHRSRISMRREIHAVGVFSARRIFSSANNALFPWLGLRNGLIIIACGPIAQPVSPRAELQLSCERRSSSVAPGPIELPGGSFSMEVSMLLALGSPEPSSFHCDSLCVLTSLQGGGLDFHPDFPLASTIGH